MIDAPFVLGSGLIFWSWQTGNWLVGLMFIFLLEAARFSSMRWDFSKQDFNRIVDVSAVSFLATTFYFVNSERSFDAFTSVVIWLPASFLLLIASQKYSQANSVPLTSLFLSLRWLEARRATETSDKRIDLTFPYFSLCLLSASAANQRSVWFYPAVFVLAMFALWFHRSRRFRTRTWLVTLITAGAAGYVVMTGVHAGHTQVHDIFLQWFKDYREHRADPYRSHTALGDIGTLKLSDKILFRVAGDVGESGPILLRDASYNVYSKGFWFAEETEFKTLTSTADVTTWELSEHPGESDSLSISAHMNAFGEGLLTLPNGTFRLKDLPVVKMQRNGLGAVKVGEGPPLIRYRVEFAPAFSFDEAYNDLDLDIADEYKEVIGEIGNELGLQEGTPQEAVQTIAEYFRQGFTYSLTQTAHEKGVTPLANFLRKTKSGHCEFYATATVLLLRQAGIPARYATGYSVQEYSWLEDAYLVRKRHGHAWALANVGGSWVNVDNTPAVWRELEEESSPAIQPLIDFFSWIKHQVQVWRFGAQEEETSVDYMVWLLVPLVLLLAWRLSGKKRISPSPESGENARKGVKHAGIDSSFYQVILRLDRLGLPRLPGESPRRWLARIAPGLHKDIISDELYEMLAIHNKYRFDPLGITREQKDKLDTWVQEWLEKRVGPRQYTDQ